MATERIELFVGVGLEFPLKLDANGKVETSTGTELVKSSIQQLLSWNLQERFFNGDYGSRLFELIEEPNDTITKKILRDYAIEAIQEWEKRVELISVEASDTTQDGVIELNINYQILGTNQEDSFIYPFYKEILF